MITNQRDFTAGLVSVIIPVYNAEKYISETIESALNQTYKPIEIVLVDDCSTDNSRTIIEQYQAKHSNIVYHAQKHNQGAAAARNTALRIASGQYIAFLDSDDMWESDKCRKQVELLSKTKEAFCYCAYDMVDEHGLQTNGKIKILEVVKYKNLLTKTMISTPTVMFDRDITGDVYMPLRRTGQDYAFWLFLLRKWDAIGIDEALVHVRRRPGSLSKNKFQNIRDVYEVQTELEGISRIKTLFNVIRYCFYTLFKKLSK